jgi:hypothetical protein
MRGAEMAQQLERLAKLGCGRAPADSLPPCGGGLGWGVVPRGAEVPHLATPTPTPNPSPQGGGEGFAAMSRPLLRLAGVLAVVTILGTMLAACGRCGDFLGQIGACHSDPPPQP